MDLADQWAIRSATINDAQVISHLLDEAQWLHQHLDWLDSSSFLGQDPFLIAFHKDTPFACIASPLSLEKVAWIRIFAAVYENGPSQIWERLWPIVLEQLQKKGCQIAAALVISPWLEPLLRKSGFDETNAVIFLEWLTTTPPSVPTFPGTIRGMRPSDIESILNIDQRAFKGIWSNPESELLEAFEQASICTVLECDQQLVGYQISTASTWGAHLARLAVDPAWQGKGIGNAIVSDLMRQVRRRGFYRLTVNTQEDNIRSCSLYRRLGFMMTGDRYPVLELRPKFISST